MSARIRFPGPSGLSLNVIVEQLATGLFWDGTTFSAAPKPLAVAEATPKGRYALTLDTPAATWANGQYAVWAVTGAGVAIDARFGIADFTLFNGDDAPPPPAVLNLSVPAGTIVNTRAV